MNFTCRHDPGDINPQSITFQSDRRRCGLAKQISSTIKSSERLKGHLGTNSGNDLRLLKPRYVAFSQSILHFCICAYKNNLWCTAPDISRTGSTQKQRRSPIDGVKVGEAHNVVEVRRDGLQVDSPGIVAVLLHQVSQQELTHRALLREGRTLVFKDMNPQRLCTYSPLLAHCFGSMVYIFNVLVHFHQSHSVISALGGS